MKNNPLDDIIKCDVEISSPASSDASFDSILLIVAPPGTAGEKTMDKTISVSKADELAEYGYTEKDAAYAAAEAAFSQSPSPDALYICVRKEVAAGTGQDAAEVSEEEGSGDTEVSENTEASGKAENSTASGTVYEGIKATLSRAASEASFYGIYLVGFRDPEDITAAIEWAESNEKMFGFEYVDMDSCPVKNFSYYRSFGVFSGKAEGYGEDDQPGTNQYAALAWMAKCFGYDPGTETWNLKELAALVPSALSSNEKKTLAECKINTFLRYAGANVTIGGYTLAGEWIDVIRFRDWLKARMQINVFNVIKANRKVPFTDKGIGLIEGAMEATLANGQAVGGIAPTEYNEADQEVPGFTVTVPRASSITEAERKSRKLAGCRYTARLAGAIHAVEIKGFLTF